jgi:Major intrinsic protein
MMGHAFPGVISHGAAVVAPALTVMAIILFMGKISGAHLNPAVCIAFALRRDFPRHRVSHHIPASLQERENPDTIDSRRHTVAADTPPDSPGTPTACSARPPPGPARCAVMNPRTSAGRT